MAYKAPPSIPNTDDPGFRVFLLNELRKIAQESSRITTEEVQFYVHHAEPIKKDKGLVVYADGTDWNPGSGGGLYEYNGTSWTALG